MENQNNEEIGKKIIEDKFIETATKLPQKTTNSNMSVLNKTIEQSKKDELNLEVVIFLKLH